MTRKTFLGDREKRKVGLKESIEGHSYLLQLKLKEKDRKETEKLIKLEKKRLKFLNNKNPLLWMALFFSINLYKRYYKSFNGGIRVWLGDFCYAYNINFKK